MIRKINFEDDGITEKNKPPWLEYSIIIYIIYAESSHSSEDLLMALLWFPPIHICAFGFFINDYKRGYNKFMVVKWKRLLFPG